MTNVKLKLNIHYKPAGYEGLFNIPTFEVDDSFMQDEYIPEEIAKLQPGLPYLEYNGMLVIFELLEANNLKSEDVPLQRVYELGYRVAMKYCDRRRDISKNLFVSLSVKRG